MMEYSTGLRNILFSRFVNGNVCRFILDGGCIDNLVSRKMVEALGLEMDWYPCPDQIECVNRGSITCVGVCRFPLSFGKKYSDSIVCEVVNMDLCDIVLGKPWLFDVGAIRRTQDYSYEFMWDKEKVILIPSPKPKGRSNKHGVQ